ncbi:MmgE/PrpD family protein [Pigmentiphaga sp. H8]|uniref:MmgE/PrpD family protein n=1 Tax=Pigmentiphaga sp. H8 TaxID=2488560 RepID=UPI000F59A6CC|nr:MmgE/PrpD family protein [Pigmentiphaga sp. H8]AZG08232.1 MmgE/PrpD family protein [Pigmentiphaga sp. H8]
MPSAHDQGGATARLAAFTWQLAFDRLPAPTVHAARRAIVNIVGCCLGGAGHETVQTVGNALLPLGGTGTATLIGSGRRTDPLTAALVNCLGSAAYAFDDTHSQTILHPSGAVATAVLALADERDLSGAQFVAAFVAGVEVASRASKAVATAPAACDIGWSQTGITAGIGAAAAAAKALGLDARGIEQAIGIAAIQSSGLRIAHGTMSSTYIFGHAGQCGLRAALLAQAGLGGPAASLEGAHGFLQLFSDHPHAPYLTDGLGTAFEVESLTYKPYPYGIVVHPAIDAALQWLSRHGNVDAIRSIELQVHGNGLTLGARRHPTTPLEAKVSLCHGIAATLVFGRAGLAEVDLPAIGDARVARLREIIELAPGEIAPEAARLTVGLADGARHTVEVSHCRGSIDNPMSDEDLTEKFMGQALLRLKPPQASALAGLCWRVDELAQVRELLASTRPAA